MLSRPAATMPICHLRCPRKRRPGCQRSVRFLPCVALAAGLHTMTRSQRFAQSTTCNPHLRLRLSAEFRYRLSVCLISGVHSLEPFTGSNGRGPVPQGSPEVRDLIHRLLRPDPAERLTMAQVMAHPWFQVSRSSALRSASVTLLSRTTAVLPSHDAGARCMVVSRQTDR